MATSQLSAQQTRNYRDITDHPKPSLAVYGEIGVASAILRYSSESSRQSVLNLSAEGEEFYQCKAGDEPADMSGIGDAA